MTESFVFKLIDKFDSSSLVSLNYSSGDTRISLIKLDLSACQVAPSVNVVPGTSVVAAGSVSNVGVGDAGVSGAGASSALVQNELAQTSVSASAGTSNVAAGASTNASDGTEFVESPIVGTFYRSPSPDSPAYAEKGSKIKQGAPLCIIEAMKMMNTLTAEFDMEVVDVLAENGALAEYGQPLFAVKRL